MGRVDVPALLAELGIQARGGRWMVGKCPNQAHPDKSPSWRINRETGHWHCFSCGAEGGPRDLVALVRGSHEGGLPTLNTPMRAEVEQTSPRGRFRLPAGVQVAPLAAWPSPARDYLSGRGVTVEQVARWGLGYAVDGRLAGRVVFPVRNSAGVLISYTARSFTGAGRRYLEPKVEEGADQGAVFGEEHWTRSEGIAVVTEGAMDALAVERVTGLSIAAVYGSQILPGHLARLQGRGRLILATDADPAGDKAADEIMGALGRWTSTVRWRPPEGFDCASLALKDPERLRRELSSLACPATGAAAQLRRRSDISGG